MDRSVLKQQWEELSQKAFVAACTAVERAPDGRWIAGSEWQVREAFSKFMQEGYQMLMQARIQEHAATSQAAFSPGRPGLGAAQQRGTSKAGLDRRG